ncbi:MAG: lipoprotein release ABC transporter permease [Bacteroidetes bacterium]|nr:MAG: lipoprotein release ABC transporter permease [Bacteroidota bacterium]
MRPETFIASRLFSVSREQMSSTIIRIAVLSVAVGLAVMMISVAVVIGFKNQIRSKVTGFVSEIQIEALNNNLSSEALPMVLDDELFLKLVDNEEIKHFQAVAQKAGIVKTDDNIQGVILKGVGDDYDWTYLNDRIVAGRPISFSDTALTSEILVSKKIAGKLNLQPGQALRMWFVDAESLQTRGRKFEISGLFETGLAEFDDRFIFGDIGHVQKLYNWQPDQFGAVEIYLKQSANSAAVAESLYYSVPVDLNVSTAEEKYPQIFDWLELQDMNVWIILLLMVLVSGITMISTLLIIILERTSMIGILKAMGAGNAFIRRIFLFNSYRILVKGMLFGNAIALTFIGLQSYFGWLKLPEESYYLSEVPVELHLYHFLLLNFGLLIIWSLALLIPVTVINAIQPSKAIRYA